MEVNGELSERTRGSLGVVPTLVRDPQPAEFEALLERRRRLGQDLFDEVWDGVLHMNPAPHSRHGKVDGQLAHLLYEPARDAGLTMTGPINLGDREDYRVPDRALLRPGPDAVYLATAAIVVEIVSPDDDTWEKLPFYAKRAVDELLIVDPHEHRVHWLALQPTGGYEPVERSSLVALGPVELSERIDWPE
jgi:Uma2 family endonuclease